MKTRTIRLFALLLVSAMYWQLVSQWSGVAEPWDAGGYWRLWYPVSLALSAVAGFVLRSRWGLAGAVVTVAQLPVMAVHAQPGVLMIGGMMILCILAIPAAAVSALAGRLRARARNDDGKGGAGSL